jgi:WD40 repeat protein
MAIGCRCSRDESRWVGSLEFHPSELALATLGEDERSVRVWELDSGVLLGGLDGIGGLQLALGTSCRQARSRITTGISRSVLSW